MSSSILDDVKHMLGLLPAEHAFDGDVLIHINSVFGTLQQLGVGPDSGFMIMDNSAAWEDFATHATLNPVKSYMFLRVKLMFDPPTTGFYTSSMERQIQELEWRLLVAADSMVLNDDIVIDGGSP